MQFAVSQINLALQILLHEFSLVFTHANQLTVFKLIYLNRLKKNRYILSLLNKACFANASSHVFKEVVYSMYFVNIEVAFSNIWS